MDDRIIKIETESRFKPPGLNLFDFLFILGFSILLGVVYNLSNPNGIEFFPRLINSGSIPEVTPSVARAECKKGDCLFLDARPSNFYEQKHVKGALNMPAALFEIMYTLDLNGKDRGKNIFVYGRTISALYDEEVANELILRGYKKVAILHGGLSAWEEEGYPVEP